MRNRMKSSNTRSMVINASTTHFGRKMRVNESNRPVIDMRTKRVQPLNEFDDLGGLEQDTRLLEKIARAIIVDLNRRLSHEEYVDMIPDLIVSESAKQKNPDDATTLLDVADNDNCVHIIADIIIDIFEDEEDAMYNKHNNASRNAPKRHQQGMDESIHTRHKLKSLFEGRDNDDIDELEDVDQFVPGSDERDYVDTDGMGQQDYDFVVAYLDSELDKKEIDRAIISFKSSSETITGKVLAKLNKTVFLFVVDGKPRKVNIDKVDVENIFIKEPTK